MNEKYQKLNRLYNEMLPRICSSPQEYNRFLQTAAFNFRMSFNNAVAAYAQNIGSDLLLSYNQWQLYGRVPRRYSKQILLYDNANKGRYAIAYPYSATVEDKRIASHKEMSFFAHENNEAVLKAVQSIYGSDETSLQRIFYSEVMEQMEAIVTEDFLAVDNAANFLSKSVVNMLLSRFGVEMPYAALPPSISAEQLQTAFRAAMDVFRAEYAELAVQIPIELQKQQQEAQPIQNDYSRYTPMAQRYFKAKDYYPDALLVMRVGDFYEAIGDDARIIADQLEFVLTSRTIAEGERTPTLTQQELDRLLIQDPAIKEGKLRIYAAYREGLGEKSILRILQQEYRDSGGVIRSNDKSFLRNCNSQGIWVGDIGGDYQPTVITYQQIYQRIGELINENRYLNERELEEYNQIGSEDNAVIDFYDVRFAYKLGDTAFLYGKPYVISAVTDDEVMVYQEDSPLFVEKYPRQRFEEILNISAKDNKHLITKGTITFDIYQLGDTDEAREMLFQSLDKWKQRGISVNHADYEKVYSGELRHGETLEDIYETFNVHHPADFTGHSLSVSDVVVIHQYGRDRAFFCDSVGFPEIKGFFEQKVIDVPAEDVVEVISSSDGIPAEEETVGAEELSQDITEAENFVITDNNIGVGTPSQRYQNNVNAIRTIHELQAENRLPAPAEQKTLSQYVGWGGLSDNLRPGSTHSYELHDLLSQEEYRAACDSVLTAFYTPPVVVKSIYKALNNMGFTNGTILDPACGTGHFFGLLPDYLRGKVTLHGIEIDKISGEIAQMLYPNANINVQGYEETKIPDNYLDVIVGNVPFGDYTVFDKAYNKHHLMIHDYFFVKSLDKVRPGGIIAFITSTGTMDKHNPIVRELLAEKADLLGAVRLPNNTFKAAAGTDVSSDIIFLQKRTSTELLRQYPDWCYTVKYDDEREINSYFAAHPEMICGKLDLKSSRFGGMDVVCVPNEDTSLADELNRAIQNIQGTYVPYIAANETDEESEAESVVADEAARNYSFFVKDETIYYREISTTL